MLRTTVVVLLFSLLYSVPTQSLSQSTDAPLSSQINVRLGRHQVLLPAGRHGLNYFPDEPLSVISKRPFTFTLTSGNTTFLMRGNSIGTARPLHKILEPSGGTEFDNGYAGITSTVVDEKRGKILAMFHAEDHAGLSSVSYNSDVKQAYWSIGMAVSKDGGNSFQKLGQILRGSLPKEAMIGKQDMTGIGDATFIVDASGEYLYAYFTDLTRKPASFPAKIGMARCRVDDGGRPGTWFKYYDGKFEEPGIGGKEGTVVHPPKSFPSDVFAPHVTYINSIETYVMACNVMVYSDHELPKAKQGGIYFCYSKDGIHWSEPELQIVGHPVPYQGRVYLAHPRLYIEKEKNNRATGWLLYCYSPRWGTAAPRIPHFLAGRRLTIALGIDSADSRSTRSKSSTASKRDRRMEEAVAGRYQLKLKNLKTGKSAEQSMTLREDNEINIDGGSESRGTWKYAGNKLFLNIPQLEIKPARLLKNGGFSGIVSGPAGVLANVSSTRNEPSDTLRVRYTLTKIE